MLGRRRHQTWERQGWWEGTPISYFCLAWTPFPQGWCESHITRRHRKRVTSQIHTVDGNEKELRSDSKGCLFPTTKDIWWFANELCVSPWVNRSFCLGKSEQAFWGTEHLAWGLDRIEKLMEGLFGKCVHSCMCLCMCTWVYVRTHTHRISKGKLRELWVSIGNRKLHRAAFSQLELYTQEYGGLVCNTAVSPFLNKE